MGVGGAPRPTPMRAVSAWRPAKLEQLTRSITEIRERVNERAREMAGEALARGADAEAELCTSLSQ